MQNAAQYANTCLVFTSGHQMLDLNGYMRMAMMWSDTQPYMSLLVQRTPSGYAAHFLCEQVELDMDSEEEYLNYGDGLSLEDIVRIARSHRVGLVAPTVHCSHAIELAIMAEKLDLPHASPKAVTTLEDKAKFTRLMRACGTLTPRSRVTRGRSEVLAGLVAIGGLCLLKPRDGYGSLAVIAVDMRHGVTDEVLAVVEWHLASRSAANFKVSLVQEFLGGEGWHEYGFMGFVADGELEWVMTTRKEMTPWPFRKECGHVYDPKDEQRLRDTTFVVLPEMRHLIRCIDHIEPGKHGLRRAFINADVLVGPHGQCCVVDMSARWGGSQMIGIANCTLGRSATDQHFPRMAARWAAGIRADLTVVGPQRAAIIRKAYTEGGQIRRYAAATSGNGEMPFYSEIPIDGLVLPRMSDMTSGPSGYSVTYPVAGVEAEDGNIETAETRWRTAIYNMGIGIERDGVLYGPQGPMVMEKEEQVA